MESDFTMEELLPIVAELAEKYTRGESSSVSYERARELMEAVLYCINETGTEGSEHLMRSGMSAGEAYEAGCRLVAEKVKMTTELYKGFICEFRYFGNENYRDTVTKAIPGFLEHYDVRFAPQETIITMDYPVLRPLAECSGIDAVYEYVKAISLEQKFLQKFPEEYVCNVLQRHHAGYRRQFFNLCGIFLRHVLGRMLTGGNLSYEKLEQTFSGCERDEAEQLLKSLLHGMVEEAYGADSQLEGYLQYELKDFTHDLMSGIRYGYLEKCVVL